MFSPSKATLLLAMLALLPAAHADQAIVIGINQYKDPHPKILKGPENDAADMAAFCRSHGYALPENHLLLGEKATKANVMAALADLEKSVKEGEKVIFYFAGHGGNRNRGGTPDCFLLPYDYADGKPEATIGMNELYAAMKRLRTKANRTVVLDSCFSGGMARDLDFTSRSYVPFASRSVVPVPPDDTQAHVGVPIKPTGDAAKDKDKICYLTAAKATEEALETEIGGKDHGLFTNALIPELAKGETCEETAGRVRTSIAKLIASKKSTRKQTPDVTEEYRDLVALKGSPIAIAVEAPPPPKPPKAVWDLLAKERPDAKKLTLAVEPNRSDVLLGQAIRLKVKVGAPGYLVVVWSRDAMEVKVPTRAPNGLYDVVRVEAGKEYPIGPPTGQAFTQPSGNRVTALLFESPGPAQELVNALTLGKPPTIEELEARGLVDVGSGSKEYVTSGLSFEVGEQLPGGLRVADAPGLLAALSKGGYGDTMTNDSDGRILAYLRDEKSDPKKIAPYLTTALNLAFEALAAKKEAFVGSDEPGLTPDQMKLVKETETKMANATKEEAVALNARLLAALFPKLIVGVGV